MRTSTEFRFGLIDQVACSNPAHLPQVRNRGPEGAGANIACVQGTDGREGLSYWIADTYAAVALTRSLLEITLAEPMEEEAKNYGIAEHLVKMNDAA